MLYTIETVSWRDGRVRLIDQTRLPQELVYLECADIETLAEAIEVLRVRGAPAIGVAAGYGLALAAAVSRAGDLPALKADLAAARERLARTRPTAVNLFWALDRQGKLIESFAGEPDALRRLLLDEAVRIHQEDLAAGEAMGRAGAVMKPLCCATVLNRKALCSIASGSPWAN